MTRHSLSKRHHNGCISIRCSDVLYAMKATWTSKSTPKLSRPKWTLFEQLPVYCITFVVHSVFLPRSPLGQVPLSPSPACTMMKQKEGRVPYGLLHSIMLVSQTCGPDTASIVVKGVNCRLCTVAWSVTLGPYVLNEQNLTTVMTNSCLILAKYDMSESFRALEIRKGHSRKKNNHNMFTCCSQ